MPEVGLLQTEISQSRAADVSRPIPCIELASSGRNCCDDMYLYSAVSITSPLLQGFQVLGNGDVYNFEQWESQLGGDSRLAALMIGRAALIKPWIFTEIKV